MVPSVASATGARAKAERAEKHFDELVTVVQRFRDSEPYEIVPKIEAATGHRVGYAREKTPFPATCVSLIVGDVLHNLRSALDLLYCDLVRANGKTVKKEDAFPICGSPKKFKSLLPQIRRRVADPAAKAIEELKPYKGGNEAYWRLHQLDITDKHRLLLTAVLSVHEIDQTVGAITTPEGMRQAAFRISIKPSELIRVYDGAEIVREVSEPYEDMRFRMEVSLDEPGIVQGEAIGPFLEQLPGLVTGTIDVLEPFL
jgi:hypothetical protein